MLFRKSTSNALRALVVGFAAAAAAGLAATPATAAPRPKLVFAGLGTASTADTGATYEGHVTGDPFPGDFSGAFAAMDGSLPAIGECEPARATIRVQGEKDRFYSLLATGEVCGIYLPLGTMQRFSGRWQVGSTNVRKLARAEGFLDVRLLNGKSDVYATQT